MKCFYFSMLLIAVVFPFTLSAQSTKPATEEKQASELSEDELLRLLVRDKTWWTAADQLTRDRKRGLKYLKAIFKHAPKHRQHQHNEAHQVNQQLQLVVYRLGRVASIRVGIWLLDAEMAESRLQLIASLAMLGPRAESAVPALMTFIDRPDFDLIQPAGAALSQIGDAAVDPLIKSLEKALDKVEANPRDRVAMFTVIYTGMALAETKAKDERAVPVLKRLFQLERQRSYRHVVSALARGGHYPSFAREQLLKHIETGIKEKRPVSNLIWDAIGTTDPEDEALTAKLFTYLKDENERALTYFFDGMMYRMLPENVVDRIFALGEATRADSSYSIFRLMTHKELKDPRLYQWALKVIEETDELHIKSEAMTHLELYQEKKEELRALAQKLYDEAEDDYHRLPAIKMLSVMGEDSKKIMKLISELGEFEWGSQRGPGGIYRLMIAVADMPLDTKHKQDLFLKALQTEDGYLQQLFVDMMYRNFDDLSFASDHLIEMIKSDKPGQVIAALAAYSKVSEPHEDVIPLLLKQFEWGSFHARKFSAFALSQFKQHQADILKVLKEGLEDQDPKMRVISALALYQLNRESDKHKARLKGLSQSDEEADQMALAVNILYAEDDAFLKQLLAEMTESKFSNVRQMAKRVQKHLD